MEESEGRAGKGEDERRARFVTCSLLLVCTVSPELFSTYQMVSEECYLNEVNLTFGRESKRCKKSRW